MNEEEPMVVFTVKMTPEQYVAIKKSADWHGMTVAEYLVSCSTGTLPRGC